MVITEFAVDIDPVQGRIAQPQAVEAQDRVVQSKGRNAFALAAAGLVLFTASCGLDEIQNAGSSQDIKETSVEKECADLEFADAASDAVKYNPTAFLPKSGGADNPDDARSYVQSLFNANGPLAGNGDKASLAAVMATVGTPARDGAGTNPNYDYVGTFSTIMAKYSAADGLAAAREDCKQLNDTMSQTAEYNPNWAQKGETITEFAAVRDINNPLEENRYNVIGMETREVVSIDTIRGVELSLQETEKGLDGFTSILISTNSEGEFDGRMFAKGVTAGEVSVNPEAETEDLGITPEGKQVNVKTLPNGDVLVKIKNERGEIEESVIPKQEFGGGTGPAAGNQGKPNGKGPGGEGPECDANAEGDCKGPAGGVTPVNPGPGPGPEGPGPEGPGGTTTTTTPRGTTTTVPRSTTTTTMPRTTTTTTPRTTTTTTPTTTTTLPKGSVITIPGAPR